jgi:hypothetical protein
MSFPGLPANLPPPRGLAGSLDYDFHLSRLTAAEVSLQRPNCQ